MPKLHSSLPFLIFVFLFLSNSSSAQEQVPDSAISQIAKEHGINTYINQMAEQSPLYNGYEFVPYGLDIAGFPWFQYADMQKGSVYYDGSLFKDVEMHYDLVGDQLVIKDFTKNYFIALVGEKVRYFKLGNDVFVRFNEGNEFNLLQGFYHRGFEGSSTVLARYIKKIQYTTNVEKTSSRYRQYNMYYIVNNRRAFEVKGKSGLVNAYRDKKNEVKKYISDNKLNFSKDPMGTLVAVARYYDQLKNP